VLEFETNFTNFKILGRDWAMLSKAVGTKSISQIKNFYYDYKKQSGKFRGGGKKGIKGESMGEIKIVEQSESLPCGRLAGSNNSANLEEVSKANLNGSIQDRLLFAHQGTKEQAVLDAERGLLNLANDSSSLLSQTLRRNDQMENSADATSRELIQHILNTQLQQQQIGQQQQIQLSQQPQSALHQLLSQQQHQIDHHQSIGQLSFEDTHRLLQHQQSQSHHQHLLSNLLPWLTASQLLQTQSRIQQVQATTALQQQESAPLSSVSERTDGMSS
jgi:hypothetical protein